MASREGRSGVALEVAKLELINVLFLLLWLMFLIWIMLPMWAGQMCLALDREKFRTNIYSFKLLSFVTGITSRRKDLLLLKPICGFGEGNVEDVTTGWTASYTWAIAGSSSTFLSLECMLSPTFPQWEPFSRTLPWESNLDVVVCDWIQLRPLYKLKILVEGCRDLLVFYLPKTSLVCKPCMEG